RCSLDREFELRFLTSRGNAFQDFFSEIMENAYPADFRRIHSHGSLGDLKCDGYLESSKTVFQVYGPEDKLSLQKLLKKIAEDFQGAQKNWSGRMFKWIFVHNLRLGLPAQAIQIISDLQAEHKGVTLDSWGYPELRQVLDRIPAARLHRILGVPPTHS